jgi:pantothenate kinase
MDAYHHPNAVLQSRTRGQHTLKQLKGHSYTLNATALAQDLAQLRSSSERVLLPIYDRATHEPTAGATAAQAQHKLVLLEGLHLLCEEPEWLPVGALLTRVLCLDVPKSVCFAATVSRKVAAGRERSDAEAHYSRVDSPIYDALVSTTYTVFTA